MGKRSSICLLAISVIVLSIGVDGQDGEAISKEIDRKLKLLNKPAVKTIQSEDGDVIDCVNIYKQPAFDHPALKNHKIQMRPSFYPEKDYVRSKNESSEMIVSQTWRRSGSCPEGTVPIRRVRRQDLLRVNSLEHFGKKNPNSALKVTSTKNRFIEYNNTNYALRRQLPNHSSARLITVGYNYLGGCGDINLWLPSIEPDDYTTAQIWVLAGQNTESLESGWMINPKLYGDLLPRFFAYWTVDDHNKTGCFDLTCTGFVHTSTEIALGVSFDPVSSERGPQYFIGVSIVMDTSTNNWWLKFGPTNVGYWPACLFRYLKHSSTAVEWGGEVYSPNVKKKPHTTTDMGSGEFPWNLLGVSCYINYVRIMDSSLSWKYPHWVTSYAEEETCYAAYNQVSYGTEPIFFFGGPGQRPPYCP